MSSVASILGDSYAHHPLKERFLKWQCHCRQMMMRDNMGRPDAAIMPDVYLKDDTQAMGTIITIMNKLPAYSETPEMLHMARKTNDHAQRRNQAIQYFSATFYQKHKQFSDILTSTFPPNSPGAAKIRSAETCRLVFEAYGQSFEIRCKVWKLTPKNLLNQSTIAHNRLFNPELPGNTIVLGFEPDWSSSQEVKG
tara:strand:+ start:664 stop:1248 length:585 start_codon:yes stop_codon:yes gene_type:complete